MAKAIQTQFWFQPVSREEAISLGEERYFSGIPCKNGHISERRTKGGHCIACQNADTQKQRRLAWREANKERWRDYKKKWQKANPKKVRAQAVRTRQKQRTDPEKWHSVKRYKADWRTKQLEEQAGCSKAAHCQACGEKHERIVFDHNHKTGKFRGWICDPCNRVLGIIDDSRQRLRQLEAYLERYEQEVTG